MSSLLRTFIYSILLCTLQMATSALGDNSMKVCVEGAYPPFSFITGDGELTGFDIDFAHEACAAMGYDCIMVKTGWEAMIPSLKFNRCAMIVASMSITDDRKKHIDFSDPYYYTDSVFVGSSEKFIYEDIIDYTDLKIGVQGGSVHQFYIETYYPNTKPILYQTQNDMDHDLRIGRIDLIFTEMIQVRSSLLRNDQDKFMIIGEKHRGGVLGNGQGIAVRKGDVGLLNKVNNIIDRMQQDGTLQELNDKYFDFNIL